MRKSNLLMLVALVLVGALCSGCRSIISKSPSEVVKAAYMAANEGKYSEVEKYESVQLVTAMKGELGLLAGGEKGLWDKQTRNGTIARLEIIKEEIRGEGAKVNIRIYFKDGQTMEDDESLIRENGGWKLAPG